MRSPSLALNLALGLMPALGLAAVVVAGRVRAHRGLEGPGHAAAVLDVSELGVIPRMDGRRPLMRRGEPSRARPPWPPAGVTHRPELRQSLRGVLTSILSARPGNGESTVLVVSSCHPGEGKTTVTSHLAVVMAETGARVLVVDGDLQHPRVHEMFNLTEAPGLAGLLDDHQDDDDTLLAAVQPTSHPRVSALPAGPAAERDSGRLYGDRLEPVLAGLRRHFDMILIDSPPLLMVPDARQLARTADGLVLVTTAHVTTVDELLTVRKRLADDGTRIVGTILNRWQSRRSEYGAYGDYRGYGDAYDGRG
jgi:capsular exopolysaccharide synthesis family protein